MVNSFPDHPLFCAICAQGMICASRDVQRGARASLDLAAIHQKGAFSLQYIKTLILVLVHMLRHMLTTLKTQQAPVEAITIEEMFVDKLILRKMLSLSQAKDTGFVPSR